MNPAITKKIAAVERPLTVDTEGGCQIVAELEGHKPSVQTFRRWPIRYRLVGRTRIYEADDVIDFARNRYQNAPVRRAPAARSRHRSIETGATA